MNHPSPSLEELQQALARGEFVYYYQPKVSMIFGIVCGAEALLRWCRPDGVVVPPGAFIPFAEECGFITEITLAMLPKLVADAAILHAVDPRLVVSFNASAQDFQSERLVEEIERVVAHQLIAPEQLEVELTESSVLAAGDRLPAILARLRATGVLLAMDDFGTGYSSIDTLSRLPFTSLKVDQGVVGRMHASEKDATIVESSIRMGHRLGLEVIGEGIETESTYLDLQNAGCTTAQGYWISRPLPLAVFLDFVREGRRWPAVPIGLLHMAILDHVEWRKGLIDVVFLNHHIPGPRPSPDAQAKSLGIEPTECRLGQWYYGLGRSFVGSPRFDAIEAPHSALHACGRELLDAVSRGAAHHELTAIMQRLTGHSIQVLSLLQELENEALARIARPQAARLHVALSSRPPPP